jgi:hypothetical protein
LALRFDPHPVPCTLTEGENVRIAKVVTTHYVAASDVEEYRCGSRHFFDNTEVAIFSKGRTVTEPKHIPAEVRAFFAEQGEELAHI